MPSKTGIAPSQLIWTSQWRFHVKSRQARRRQTVLMSLIRKKPRWPHFWQVTANSSATRSAASMRIGESHLLQITTVLLPFCGMRIRRDLKWLSPETRGATSMQTKFVYFFKLLTTATQCHDRETYNAVSQYRDLRRMRHTTHVCFGSWLCENALPVALTH